MTPDLARESLKTLRHFFWAVVAMAGIVTIYRLGPQVAESVRPLFIAQIDTAGFEHARPPKNQ